MRPTVAAFFNALDQTVSGPVRAGKTPADTLCSAILREIKTERAKFALASKT